MNRRKLTLEHKAYFASIAHLDKYFDLNRVRPFKLGAESKAKVDDLLNQHDIPVELNSDIYWIFGYIKIQYTLDFERDKAKWKEEREIYRNPDTKVGVEFYERMPLPYWENVESISIKVKENTSINGIREESVKITYPAMIRFIIEAIEDKRYSEHEIENKGHFFSNELLQLEKYTQNNEWTSPFYLTIRQKQTIEELYCYLSYNTDLSHNSICQFGSKLMFIAGVPFNSREDYKGKRIATGLHDEFDISIAKLFRKYAPIPPPQSSNEDDENSFNKLFNT